MPGRNAQVSRLFTLLNLMELSPQGSTVNELLSKLKDRGHQVEKRTVYRDLEALQAAGFPLQESGQSDDTGATRWTLEKVTRINEHFVLTARELLALYMAKGVLAPLRETPFYESLQSVFNKIQERIGERGSDHLNEIANEIHFEPGPRWGLGIDPDLLETVRACCAEKQLLEVSYSSANSGNKTTRKLGPHFLYFSKGSLYLVAEDLKDKQVKVFSLPRMSDATMLDETYQGQPVEPDQFFKDSFGIFKSGQPVSIKIEFGPLVAPFVKERRWHESQTIVSKSDGSIVMNLEVAITPELVQWVLGFGEHAVVIEPFSLRNEVVGSANKLIKKYSSLKAA